MALKAQVDPAAEVRIAGSCSGRYAYGGDCGFHLGTQVAVTAVVSASFDGHSGRFVLSAQATCSFGINDGETLVSHVVAETAHEVPTCLIDYRQRAARLRWAPLCATAFSSAPTISIWQLSRREQAG